VSSTGGLSRSTWYSNIAWIAKPINGLQSDMTRDIKHMADDSIRVKMEYQF
jgi:hypothetical protein